jgi:hypothetical protein
VHEAEQVPLDYTTPYIGRNGLQAREDGETGVVEPNVDAPEARECSAAECLDMILTRHVRRYH